MTHKLILKVNKFQLSSAKHFSTVEEKPPGVGGGGGEVVGFHPPYHLGLSNIFFFFIDYL